ncbi:D-alanyl-D-alanine carboxypeptidase [Neorhizobium sp. NCHU2750]|uniref:D-alanyl-D-alanine carboxypeptidase n=1 Tax=Neorhizobium sp. NCHU2750 TaxID=1825976 RepID=UPI000E70DAC8|nr:D-alanyl-D-alanine carboxypeptidase [Neorhizobium sp. NCHU2750]
MPFIQRIIALVFVVGAMSMASRTAEAGYAHFIYDAQSGKVLAAENSDELNHPASLTKMMTLYLTFEALHNGRLHWDDEIVMTANAASKIPFKLGVQAGKTITVREAVYAMAIRSANDAAAAMGDRLGGTEDQFGVMMTNKAHQLGMNSTVFRNASGLPDDAQVTTARDLAVLALSLIRDYPEEYKIFSERSFVFRGRRIRGHNNLMYRYPGMDGIKTGFVNASGFNIASAVNVDGRRIIGVMMGGKSARQRDDQMAALLDQFVPGRQVAPAPVIAAVTAKEKAQDKVRDKRPAAGSAAAATETLAAGSRKQITLGMPARAASVTPYAEPSKTETAESLASAAAGPVASVARKGEPLWDIQIAAAGSKAAASGAIDTAMPLMADFGQIASNVQSSQSGGKQVFRARLAGFADRDAATRACALLKARSIDCFVVR